MRPAPRENLLLAWIAVLLIPYAWILDGVFPIWGEFSSRTLYPDLWFYFAAAVAFPLFAVTVSAFKSASYGPAGFFVRTFLPYLLTLAGIAYCHQLRRWVFGYDQGYTFWWLGQQIGQGGLWCVAMAPPVLICVALWIGGAWWGRIDQTRDET